MLALKIIVTCISVILTYKANTRRLKLRQEQIPQEAYDIITLTNECSFTLEVSAIGIINNEGEIDWMEKSIRNFHLRHNTNYPLQVEGKASYKAGLNHNRQGFWRFPKMRGYCVQLECGRTFFHHGTLELKQAYPFYLKSLLSRITAGRWGFERPDASFYRIRD